MGRLEYRGVPTPKSYLMLAYNLALGFCVDHRVMNFSQELTEGTAFIVSMSFEITEGPTKQGSI